MMNIIYNRLYFLLYLLLGLLFLASCNPEQENHFVPINGYDGEIFIDFSVAPNDVGVLKTLRSATSLRAAAEELTTNEEDDTYVRDIWVFMLEDTNVVHAYNLADAPVTSDYYHLQRTERHPLRLKKGESKELFFIANLFSHRNDDGILNVDVPDPTTIETRAELLNLDYNTQPDSAKAKALDKTQPNNGGVFAFSLAPEYATKPSVRPMVAQYIVGLDDRGVYYQDRFYGSKDSTKVYAALHPQDKGVVVPVMLTRKFAKMEMTLQIKVPTDEQQAAVGIPEDERITIEDMKNRVLDMRVGFQGFSKRQFLFKETPKLPNLNPKANDDPTVTLNPEYQNKDAIDRRLFYWHYADKNTSSELLDADGNPVPRKVVVYFPTEQAIIPQERKAWDINTWFVSYEYNLPAIMVNFIGIAEHKEPVVDGNTGATSLRSSANLYVNTKTGNVFGDNTFYDLAVNVTTRPQKIFLGQVVYTGKGQGGTGIGTYSLGEEGITQFFNDIRVDTKANYVEGQEKQMVEGRTMFKSAGLRIGNIHDYDIVIETYSSNSPAQLIQPTDNELPMWIHGGADGTKKVYEREDLRTSILIGQGENSNIFYRQIWVVSPQEIVGDNTLLRATLQFAAKNDIDNYDEMFPDIGGENLIARADTTLPGLTEEQKKTYSIMMRRRLDLRLSFNVLARYAELNLGNLNEFAGGLKQEIRTDPETGELYYDYLDKIYEGGKIYQFGRNVPLDVDYIANNSNLQNWRWVTVNIGGETTTGNLQSLLTYQSVLRSPNTAEVWWNLRVGYTVDDLNNSEFGAWGTLVKDIVDQAESKSIDASNYKGTNKKHPYDPCPEGYRIPTSEDLKTAFYNELPPAGSNNKTIPIMNSSYQGTAKPSTEKNVVPSGSLQGEVITNVNSYYYRPTSNSVYALRFTRTKYASVFHYNFENRGLEITVQPADNADMTYEQMVQKINNNGGKYPFDDLEKVKRTFPWAPMIYGTAKPIAYGGNYNGSWNKQSSIKRYSDLWSNTIVSANKAFDIDIDPPSTANRVVAPMSYGLTVRCIRL